MQVSWLMDVDSQLDYRESLLHSSFPTNVSGWPLGPEWNYQLQWRYRAGF